jgi:predicted enzyme related to lactoylglutathione lyase
MHGNFFWYDLMTTDTAAAKSFYGGVLGWGAQDSGTPGMNYTLFTVAGAGLLGLMPEPKEMRDAGVPPSWLGYVQVDDVDAAVSRIEKLGGKKMRDPVTVPDVIRFCPVADPQGAGFLVATPMPRGPLPQLPPNHPGTVGWRELYAADAASVFGFYAEAFGWTKGDAVDMGPMGTYQLFKTPGDAEAVGGMMTRPPGVPAPHWGYYFNVDAIDAGAARVKAHGGKVLNGPMPVPGGGWIAQCMDPQGALFSLTGPKA